MNPLKTRYSGASGTWGEKLRFEYDWNPRDQMERVDKFVNGAAIPVGYVVYRYCLSCDGALSEREEHGAYSGGSHPIVSWQRYEYHGLDLVRVDERYDSSGGSITSGDPWRTLEVSSHRPGAIGSLLAKRVYTHTNNDATPDTTKNFFYTYDPVGNVVSVMDDNGNEAYHFTQEAFGNELPVNVLGGSDWDDAADDRIMEHQTGKWRDEFTGLYYFWARWYDPEVGRFVKRSPLCVIIEHPYTIAHANPVTFLDPTGKKPVCDQRVYEEEFNRVKTQIAPQANKRNNQAKFGSCGERALGIAKDIKQAKLCCWDVAVVTSKTKWGEGYLSCHTYHTVTVMKLIDTKARSWLDLTNRIFDDWEHQTPITGQGTLHQMGMGWFVNKFPIFVTVDDGNCRGDGTGSCWGE